VDKAARRLEQGVVKAGRSEGTENDTSSGPEGDNCYRIIDKSTFLIGARNHACYIKEMLPPELPCMCPHVLGERVRDVAP
jgi:hypothetical protein